RRGRMALQHLWPHGRDWRESLQHPGRRSRRSHRSVHLPRRVPQDRPPRLSKRAISPRQGAATLHPTLFGISEGNRNLIVALNGFLATVITGDVDRTRCEDQRSFTAPASARGSRPSRALFYENISTLIIRQKIPGTFFGS